MPMVVKPSKKQFINYYVDMEQSYPWKAQQHKDF